MKRKNRKSKEDPALLRRAAISHLVRETVEWLYATDDARAFLDDPVEIEHECPRACAEFILMLERTHHAGAPIGEWKGWLDKIDGNFETGRRDAIANYLAGFFRANCPEIYGYVQ